MHAIDHSADNLQLQLFLFVLAFEKFACIFLDTCLYVTVQRVANPFNRQIIDVYSCACFDGKIIQQLVSSMISRFAEAPNLTRSTAQREISSSTRELVIRENISSENETIPWRILEAHTSWPTMARLGRRGDVLLPRSCHVLRAQDVFCNRRTCLAMSIRVVLS